MSIDRTRRLLCKLVASISTLVGGINFNVANGYEKKMDESTTIVTRITKCGFDAPLPAIAVPTNGNYGFI